MSSGYKLGSPTQETDELNTQVSTRIKNFFKSEKVGKIMNCMNNEKIRRKTSHISNKMQGQTSLKKKYTNLRINTITFVQYCVKINKVYISQPLSGEGKNKQTKNLKNNTK